MTDDYEILPSNEVEYLRKEIEKIKAKPFGADTDTLIGSIRQLQSSIDALVKIFAEANHIVSSGDIRPPARNTMTNDPSTLSRLEMQNEKIAKSILNLASSIKNQENQHRMEYQDFLRKKDAKQKQQAPPQNVTSGIVPSGLAPLSMASRQAEHENQQLPNIEQNTPAKNPNQYNKQNPSHEFSFSKTNNEGASGDDELPEPPKPLY